MDPLPNINYIPMQAKPNAIITVIYLTNVLYTCEVRELTKILVV